MVAHATPPHRPDPAPIHHATTQEERTLYRNVGGMGYIIQTDDMPGGSQEVFPLTPPLASLAGGTFWLRKDKCVGWRWLAGWLAGLIGLIGLRCCRWHGELIPTPTPTPLHRQAHPQAPLLLRGPGAVAARPGDQDDVRADPGDRGGVQSGEYAFGVTGPRL